MFILLDIDGVMLPEPCEHVQILSDGFKAFDSNAARNISSLIEQTKASIILTSNHRVSFSKEQWIAIFYNRGINITTIDFINELPFEKMMDRATEIKAWAESNGDSNFVIIDDDHSLNTLPTKIKQRCVMTHPLVGLDLAATNKALGILLNNPDISMQ